MKQLVTDLWYGRVPLARAFWEYAIVYGTLANLVTTLLSLAAFAKDLPAAFGLGIFFLPAPYNFLMVVAVWRSAARYQGPAIWSKLARILIVIWAAVCTLA
jgi:hypothetical protein